MRNHSTYFSILKSFGYLALALMALAIVYVACLAVVNWKGISV